MGNCIFSASRFRAGDSALNGGSGELPEKSINIPTTSISVSMEAIEEVAVTVPKFRPLHQYSYNDLKLATRGFRQENLLGQGGFGCVFKGLIDEQTYLPTKHGQGLVVAVKKLDQSSSQGHREWMAEVSFLSELHHPNLVKLIGHCAENDHRLLVYECMSRGSLDNHLFRKGNLQYALSWSTRINIIIGAARGLAYLHNASRQIIFRDFKAANILLDSEFNAKISDFGLAKDGPKGDKTHVSTRIMGTFGYAAPEYVATGHLTAKSDVYSFGVVLLEILTGREAIDRNRPTREQNLVEWAKPYLKDDQKVMRIIDQRLGGQYSLREARSAVAVVSTCLCSDAKRRPTMDEIVKSLESLNETSKHKKDLHQNGF